MVIGNEIHSFYDIYSGNFRGVCAPYSSGATVAKLGTKILQLQKVRKTDRLLTNRRWPLFRLDDLILLHFVLYTTLLFIKYVVPFGTFQSTLCPSLPFFFLLWVAVGFQNSQEYKDSNPGPLEVIFIFVPSGVRAPVQQSGH